MSKSKQWYIDAHARCAYEVDPANVPDWWFGDRWTAEEMDRIRQLKTGLEQEQLIFDVAIKAIHRAAKERENYQKIIIGALILSLCLYGLVSL